MKNISLPRLIVIVLAIALLLIYVRTSFAEETTPVTGKPGIRLDLSSKDSVKQVKAFLVKTDAEGKETPIKDVDVKFYVQRTFSLLPLEGDNATTDETGLAYVDFPGTLPGDSAGNVTIIARLEDNDELGELSATKTINWGKPTVFENTLNQRALWSAGNNAPWSLVIFVTGAIIGVWGVIIFVITQLFKINKLGKL